MTATVLAKQSDVSLYTVRHYTRIGLLKPSRNTQNNYKLYQPSDAVRVRFIKAAGNLGFSLSEIADILKEAKTREFAVSDGEGNYRPPHCGE